METKTPIETKTFLKDINNSKYELKLSSSEDILSLSTEINNKKYRLLTSFEELQNNKSFFKQFSTFNETVSALSKIISLSNDIMIKGKELIIKFKNFLDKEISIELLEEDNDNIDVLYINFKKLEIENNNIKQLLLKNNNSFELNKNNFKKNINNSIIIKDIEEEQMIKNWINNDKKVFFKLIYKAQRDGDDTYDFHKLCDGISPTLTLAKTKNGNRFGGYTSVPLTTNAESETIYDKNAFVFSIDNKSKYNIKKPSNAVHSKKNYGPFFGSNSAFYIGNKFLSQNKSYSNPTNDYESPPYILTGSEYFTLEELEVYNVYIE